MAENIIFLLFDHNMKINLIVPKNYRDLQLIFNNLISNNHILVHSCNYDTGQKVKQQEFCNIVYCSWGGHWTAALEGKNKNTEEYLERPYSDQKERTAYRYEIMKI